MIKHYLLTKIDFGNEAAYLKVFEQYCYSSIKRQGNKNFTWLVGINHHLPSYIWEEWADCQQFQNIMLVPGDNFAEKAQKWIQDDLIENIGKSEKISHVITTQIRWDQGISRDFVDIIRNEVVKRKPKPGSGLVINPALGIYVNTLSKVAKQESLVSGLSPLVSLTEPKEDFLTVLWYQRQELKEPFPVINIRDRPLWVRVIHRLNSIGESQMNFGKFRIDHKMFKFIPAQYLNQVLNTPANRTSEILSQKRDTVSTNRDSKSLKKYRRTIYNRYGRHVYEVKK